MWLRAYHSQVLRIRRICSTDKIWKNDCVNLKIIWKEGVINKALSRKVLTQLITSPGAVYFSTKKNRNVKEPLVSSHTIPVCETASTPFVSMGNPSKKKFKTVQSLSWASHGCLQTTKQSAEHPIQQTSTANNYHQATSMDQAKHPIQQISTANNYHQSTSMDQAECPIQQISTANNHHQPTSMDQVEHPIQQTSTTNNYHQPTSMDQVEHPIRQISTANNYYQPTSMDQSEHQTSSQHAPPVHIINGPGRTSNGVNRRVWQACPHTHLITC